MRNLTANFKIASTPFPHLMITLRLFLTIWNEDSRGIIWSSYKTYNYISLWLEKWYLKSCIRRILILVFIKVATRPFTPIAICSCTFIWFMCNLLSHMCESINICNDWRAYNAFLFYVLLLSTLSTCRNETLEKWS